MLNLTPKSDAICSNFSQYKQDENTAIREPDYIVEDDQQSVLLVDDQIGYLELMCEAIAEIDQKLTVYTAKDGEEAWAKLVHQSTNFRDTEATNQATFPSLVITDLNLPKLSGLELLSRIKNDDYLKVIPVVVLSTSQLESDILQCYAAQANCFVTKPDNIDDFFRVMESILAFWLNLVSLPSSDLN